MADDDRVTFKYDSVYNIRFRGEIVSEITVGDWIEMSERDRNEIVSEIVNSLVDISPTNVEW